MLIFVGLIGYVVILYNNLIQVKHKVDQAWANIDVLLKQRAEEIPQLVETVRAYLVYEKELLQKLTALRSQAMVSGQEQKRLQTELRLETVLTRLFVVAEQYPDLQANQNFLALQSRITALEEQIAHRREFYNDTVSVNNIRMEQVPEVLLASVAGMQRRPLFIVPLRNEKAQS